MITVGELIDALSEHDDEAPVAVRIPDGFRGATFRPVNVDDFALCTSAGWVLIDLDGTWEAVE